MSSRKSKPLFIVAMDAARRRKVTPADKLVFGYFAVMQGGNGECWPGIRTIATDLGLSEDTVKQSIRRLCAAGLIRKTPGSRGRKHSNRYSVCLEKRGAERPISDDTKGAQSAVLDEQKSGALAEEIGRTAPQSISGGNHKTSSSTRTTGQPQAKTRRRKKAQSIEYTPEFERFWDVYPRKEKKVAAFELWAEFAPDAQLVETIVASVRQHIQSAQWSQSLAEDGGKYVPLATTFLNQRRWEDTPVTKPEPQRGDLDWLPTEEEAEEIVHACQMGVMP
jgi:hypothetical protein